MSFLQCAVPTGNLPGVMEAEQEQEQGQGQKPKHKKHKNTDKTEHTALY